jgi:hypothetical protein
MRAIARLLFFAVATVALFLGGAWALARWQHGIVAGLDLPGAGHDLMTAFHEGETLEAQARVTHERLMGKNEVVAALLDGRLSLREAGDQFRVLSAEKAEGEAGPEAGASPEELSDEAVYANLLQWVNASASGKPAWHARADQLRAEAASLLHRPLQGV